MCGDVAAATQRCDPPEGFGATWEYDGDVSWIEPRLTEAPEGGTRFELDHIMRVDDNARWAEFGPGAVGIGWEMGLVGSRSTSGPGHPWTRRRPWPGSGVRRGAA
ncbi:hypothetical protein [Streptomyces cavernae]|uniref:hypothetical protein n=1 Tax=Streptomyces cavernae TaxID=2259034 RepID=UPI000FEBCCB2|nr:hypothetical protein [Streptomyces cavernae]